MTDPTPTDLAELRSSSANGMRVRELPDGNIGVSTGGQEVLLTRDDAHTLGSMIFYVLGP